MMSFAFRLLPSLRFPRTSTFRLSMLYMALFGLSVIALLGFIYVSTSRTMQMQTDESIEMEMKSLTENRWIDNADKLKNVIDRKLETVRVEGWVYLLTDSAFRKVAGNLRGWPTRSTKNGKWMNFALEPHLTGQEEASGDPGKIIMARALVFTMPSGHVLLIGRDLREKQSFQRTMRHAVIWAVLVTLVMGIGGGLVMSRMLLNRINVITRGAERIMRGGVNLRLPVVGTGDEFDRLTETLNAMLAAIERLMQSMQAVTTNLAHDLRSPLTRMKSRLELALLVKNDKPDHEALYRETLEYAILESDQLLATFNALLSIADAEGGKARQSMATVDLFALALDAVELYMPVAEENNLNLVMNNDDTVNVYGHRQLLFQALTNLIDNAIKYTQAGGTITVSVSDKNGAPELTVEDNGPGIPQEDQSRVLERFVRLDQSRSTRGNGLGLSLVAAIARLHNADLLLEQSDPGNLEKPGLKVTLRFFSKL